MDDPNDPFAELDRLLGLARERVYADLVGTAHFDALAVVSAALQVNLEEARAAEDSAPEAYAALLALVGDMTSRPDEMRSAANAALIVALAEMAAGFLALVAARAGVDPLTLFQRLASREARDEDGS